MGHCHTSEEDEQPCPSPALQGRGGTPRARGAQAMLKLRGTISIVSPPKASTGQEGPVRVWQPRAGCSEPSGAGKATLGCLPSSCASCRSLPAPPAPRVSEEEVAEAAAAEGLAGGAGPVCGGRGSPFPTCPRALEGPCPGTAAGAAEPLRSPLGTLGGGSRSQPRGGARAAASPALGRAESELLLERRERHFPGLPESSIQTLQGHGSRPRVGELCWALVIGQG